MEAVSNVAMANMFSMTPRSQDTSESASQTPRAPGEEDEDDGPEVPEDEDEAGAAAEASGEGGGRSEDQSLLFFREMINSLIFPMECFWLFIAILHVILI